MYRGWRAAGPPTSLRDTIVDLSIQRRRDYGTKLVKLFFASSFSAQSAIDPLSIKNLLDEMLQHDFQCRVGSLNVRQADDELLGLVRRAGQDRVTFAPETVESLRQSIGKPYSKDDKLIYIAEQAGEHDLGLDLYTMLGVPGEEPRHVRQPGSSAKCAVPWRRTSVWKYRSILRLPRHKPPMSGIRRCAPRDQTSVRLPAATAWR